MDVVNMKIKLSYIPMVIISFLFTACSPYHQLSPQYAPIHGGQIEYYQLGQGSPIVLIPGYATDVSSWSRTFISSLATEHELIVLNNRNVGGSHIDSTRYTTRDLAQDVHQLIQHLHLKNPAVLGISMGGMIAQQLAALYPHALGQLILINTAISGHKAVHPSPVMENKILSIPHNQIGFYWVAVNSFFPASWRMRMAYRLVSDRFLPKHLTKVDYDAIIPPQHALLMDWMQDELTAKKLSHLPMPVLILSGDADEVIPPINSQILAQTIPHSRLQQWENGGHAMIYQFPKEMAKQILSCISSE